MYSTRKKIKIQGKTASHRKALVKSQVVELIRTGKIKTSTKKAKLLKATFDKIVTAEKKKTISGDKAIRSFFGENERAIERFKFIVGDKLMDRQSGYVRVIKTLARPGDNADQAYVMLMNTELKEKGNKRVQKLLEKREENKEKKGGVVGRLTRGISKEAKAVGGVSQEKATKTRRVSM